MALGYPASWHYIIYNGPDKTQGIQNFPCITILNVLFQHLFSMANLALNEDYLQYIQDLHVQAKATNAIILHSKATKLQTVNCSNLITKSSKNIPESWIQPCKGQDLPSEQSTKILARTRAWLPNSHRSYYHHGQNQENKICQHTRVQSPHWADGSVLPLRQLNKQWAPN